MKSDRLKTPKFLFKVIGYVFIAWLIGFGLFWIRLPYASQENGPAIEKTDAVIVLTGGPNRLEAGLQFLETGVSKKMLISGVHKDVLPKELVALTGAKPALFDCCIELGYQADSTVGNAEEASTWASKHQLRRIVLVTSDYHMQRSLILFRKHMPDIEITALSVQSNLPVLKLAKEYNKYLITLIRAGLGL